MTTHCNVLISSAGRRVQLLEQFRRSLSSLGLDHLVVATDMSLLAPALAYADATAVVPPVGSPTFVDSVIQVCEEQAVDLLIPTIDTELAVYAREKERFLSRGTRIAVSAPEAIQIAADKRKTHSWLVDHGFPTVEQWELKEVLSKRGSGDFPLIVKPVQGSSSEGVELCQSIRDLRRHAGSDSVVQTLAAGREYTVSAFVASSGKCLVTVPRLRLEVRGGEVSKARTENKPAMEHLVRDIVETLPGAYGALNVQVFWDESSMTQQVIEINARFGGGDPLAWIAGADIPRWLIQDALGMSFEPIQDRWRANVEMSRFDRAVYRISEGHIIHA